MITTPCPGCGLGHETLDLDPVDDLDATGECAREFGGVSAPFYAEAALVPKRQYVVDAYACQHPSVRTRRAVQTTALCLMTLDLVLDVGLDVALASRLHQQMMRKHPAMFIPLSKPDLAGTLTHRHLARAQAQQTSLERAAREWAESVWQAWRGHHDQVRQWNHMLVPEWLT